MRGEEKRRWCRQLWGQEIKKNRGYHTSRFLRLGRSRQRDQPHDAREDDEPSQQKNRRQGQLLRQLELQPPDGRHRHEDNDEIANRIKRRVRIPRRAKIEAGARLPAVPDPVYGVALEDGRDAEGGGSDQDDGGEDLGEALEVPLDEDAEVEEDDGEFGEGDEEFVDDLAAVPELRGSVSLDLMGG